MVNASKEELKAVRNRNNPVKDETHLIAGANVKDEYTCTKTKARMNELENLREMARIEKECTEL